MDAYTIYEVTRRTDSEYPTFAGLQIQEEEILKQVEVEADHSDCEIFYCETCKQTSSYEDAESGEFDMDNVEIKDWGFACPYDGIHAHATCPCGECEMCAGPHNAEHRTDSADVIRVKVPGCGSQFEQAMNSRNEVIEYREVERNWFTAYDYENLSETPSINEDGGKWLQLYADYSSDPRGSYKPATLDELDALLDQIAHATSRNIIVDDSDFEGTKWAFAKASEGRNVYLAVDEDGYYFAVEVA
jgi:hypothetical protein